MSFPFGFNDISALILNIILASFAIGLLCLFVERSIRQYSLPLRHRVLCLGLAFLVISPLISWFANQNGYGLIVMPLASSIQQSAAEWLSPNNEARSTPLSTSEHDGIVRSGGSMPGARYSPAAFAGLIPTPASSTTRFWQIIPDSLSRSMTVWLMLLWGIGASAGAQRMLLGILLLRRLRSSLRTTPNLRLLTAAQNALAGTRFTGRVAICESQLAPGPLTMGFWKPAIVLPEGVADLLTDEQLTSVLAHEAAHLERRDAWFAFLQTLAGIGLWWNPCVRAINARIAIIREQLCDDYVVRRLGDGLPLARAIVRILEWSTTPHPKFPSFVPLLSDYEEVAQRICRLSNRDRATASRLNRSTSILIGAAALLLLLIPLFPVLKIHALLASPDDIEKDDEVIAKQLVAKIRVHVVDPDGNPIADARVGCAFHARQFESPNWFAVNRDGVSTIVVSNRKPQIGYLFARAEGYAPMRATWTNLDGRPDDPLPEEFTFKMVKSVSMGGLILDEEGHPIQGATVLFSAGDFQSNPASRAQPTFFQEKYLTDKLGAWRCNLAPSTPSTVSINVQHPDFAINSHTYDLNSQLEDLVQFKHTWILKKGISVTGRVTDAKGQPVAGASLVLLSLNSTSQVPIRSTDEDGRYRFDRVLIPDQLVIKDPIALTVSIAKPGFRPVMQCVPGFGDRPLNKSTNDERIVDFKMEPGVELTFRVLDAQKRPIKFAWVNPMAWHDTRCLESLRPYAMPERADENGIWRWSDAPPGEIIHFAIEAKGFARVNDHAVTIGKDATEVTISMNRPQVISGKVINAVTRQPIPEFVLDRAFEGVGGFADGLHWTADVIRGKDGEFESTVTMPPHNGVYSYRIVAEGFEPAIKKSVPFKEGELKLNFELKPKAQK